MANIHELVMHVQRSQAEAFEEKMQSDADARKVHRAKQKAAGMPIGELLEAYLGEEASQKNDPTPVLTAPRQTKEKVNEQGRTGGKPIEPIPLPPTSGTDS